MSLGYDDRMIVADLSVEIPTGRITTIVGPNACGKSTLLRGLARLLAPTKGAVLLDGASIRSLKTKQVATKIGLLPQTPTAPEGITVHDLVARGRYPHQGVFSRWNAGDDAAVDAALAATGTAGLAGRPIDELSGGQRQRVWIAMALAQETGILLLDEPTTFLDLSHQIEVLDVLIDLNRSRGTTVVMVLHDLNLAARYTDHLIAMAGGAIVAQGTPGDVVTVDLVREVFGVESLRLADPVTGTPLIVPLGRHHRAAG